MAADLGFVRVPVENGGELGGGGVEVELGDVVEEVDVAAFEEQDFSFRQGPSVSPLPRTAVRGAILRRGSRILGSPTSPRWRIRSTPSSAGGTSGRSRPWVSLTTPIFNVCLP